MPQSGFLKSSTSPTPSTGSAVVTEYVYDLMGRVRATKRTGDSTWTCVTVDDRGRTTQTVYPAYGASPARTATYNHAEGGNPLVSSASDLTGDITSTIDLLGRTVSSVDVWGTITTPTYEALTGRVLSTTTTITASEPDVQTVQTFDYDEFGRVLTVSSATHGGTPVTATLTYYSFTDVVVANRG